MNKEEVCVLIDNKLGPINEFIDVFSDVPMVAAKIYNDAKNIIDILYESDVKFNEIKDSQSSLENNLRRLKKLLE